MQVAKITIRPLSLRVAPLLILALLNLWILRYGFDHINLLVVALAVSTVVFVSYRHFVIGDEPIYMSTVTRETFSLPFRKRKVAPEKENRFDVFGALAFVLWSPTFLALLQYGPMQFADLSASVFLWQFYLFTSTWILVIWYFWRGVDKNVKW